MSLHADVLLIRGDVRATISAVLAGFGAGEVQQVARGSYSEVLASAGAGEHLFAVRWVDGWTIVVGGALTIYGRDDALEKLATHLGCEVLVANAVGTSGAYGFSLFNPNPTRQFAIHDDVVVLDEGPILAAESTPSPRPFGESDLMLVLAKHTVDLRAAWALPDWDAWARPHLSRPSSSGETLRSKRRARLAVPTAVSVDASGWTRCPECNRRFSVSDPSAFSDGKHKCGKYLAVR